MMDEKNSNYYRSFFIPLREALNTWYYERCLTLDPPAQVYDLLTDSVYKHPSIGNYLHQTLGFLGGTYGLTHRNDELFFLIQKATAHRKINFPVIRMPYLDGQGQELVFADLSFTALRSIQKLYLLKKFADGSNTWTSPESYRHLPPSGGLSICVAPWEKKIREATSAQTPAHGLQSLSAYRFVYCSHGEISLFLWAWLWLRGQLTLRDNFHGHLSVEDDLKYLDAEHWMKFWSRDFWKFDVEHIYTDHNFADDVWSLEKTQLERICATSPSHPLMVNEGDIDLFMSQKETILAREQALFQGDGDFSDQFLLAKWQRLHLLDGERRPTVSCRRMLEFALVLYNRRLTAYAPQEGPPFVRTALTELSRLAGELGAGVAGGQRAQPMALDAMQRIEHDLRNIMVFVLGDPAKTADGNGWTDTPVPNSDWQTAGLAIRFWNLKVIECLRQLNDIARFPIVQYYCLQTLLARPIEHLVFPVYDTGAFTESIFIANIDERQTGYLDNKTENTSISAVALALSSVIPMDEMGGLLTRDDRPLHDPEAEISDVALLRLLEIQQAVTQMAAPLVDHGFFGELVRNDIIRLEHNRQMGAILHQTMGMLNYLMTNPQETSSTLGAIIATLLVWNNSPTLGIHSIISSVEIFKADKELAGMVDRFAAREIAAPELCRFYAKRALAVTYYKIMRKNNRKIQNIIHECNPDLASDQDSRETSINEWASAILAHLNPAITIDPLMLESGNRSQFCTLGFYLFFYHAFWQAAYHALLARPVSGENLLAITILPEEWIIRNRYDGTLVHQANQKLEGSPDQKFLEMIARKMTNDYRIYQPYGPRLDSGADWYETGMRLFNINQPYTGEAHHEH